MTKRCNLFLYRVSFFVAALFLICLQSAVAQSTTTETDSSSMPPADTGSVPKETTAPVKPSTPWTVASMVFDFAQRRDLSASERAISTELPALILNQLSGSLERIPDSQEFADRSLRDLRKKRQSLFLQLSKELQTRDSLVLGNYSERELRTRIKEADKKIEEIRNQIDDNILEVEKVIQSVDDKDKTKSSLSEQVVIYQNDATKLYVPIITESGKPDFAGYAFGERVLSAGINSLMSGTVTIHGAYVSCAVELYVYPGGRMIGAASEIGRLDNLAMIAQSIAQQLQPQITFEMPVTLVFDVEPPEAAERAMLTVDDVVYTKLPHTVTVHSGVHTILFSADGFESAGTSYNFVGSGGFNISAKLKPVVSGSALLRLSAPTSGSFYINSIKTPMYDNPETAVISVNGNPVLGQFITEDGSAALFYVPEKLLTDGNTLTVKARTYDRSEDIEKRRKWMYTAYSVFMVSLIPTFYTYGTFSSELIAYQNKRGSYESASAWQTASWISAGVTIAAAGFFVFELVRYLMAANSVLPATAKKANYTTSGMVLRTPQSEEKSQEGKKTTEAEKSNDEN